MHRRSNTQITEGVIWKQLLLFFFPFLLGSFFQQMYNTADTIIVGRAIGTQALAAVGSSASLINLINGFFIGLSSGATVVLSQYYGASDQEGAAKALHTGFFLSLVLGGLTTFFGLLLGPSVLRLMKTPDNCLSDAVIYVQICFSGAVFTMVYNMGTGILRAMGDSRRPMIFLMVCCFINILMDVLCVMVWKMGVAGAAIATVIAQGISALMVTAVLRRLPKEYRLQWKKLLPDPHVLKRILLIGIPAGLQFITYDLSNLITQSGVNAFGDVTTAAWTAYTKSDAIIWMVISAFGVTITTFVGQNFGARKIQRIHKSIWVCLGMSAVIVGLLSAVEVIYREWILGIYTTDPSVIQVGASAMLWTVPFCALFLPVEVLGGAMRGTGYSLVPTLTTGVFACVFRSIWVLLLGPRLSSLGLLIVCYPISWLLCAIVFFIVYFRGRWLKKSLQGADALKNRSCP